MPFGSYLKYVEEFHKRNTVAEDKRGQIEVVSKDTRQKESAKH
jgi:hypothetical protein